MTPAHIVEVCRRLYARQLISAADGNVSLRISDHEIWITPSGKNKGFIAESDLARIDIHNNVHSGKPSGERLMHLEVYRKCPDACAVIHAHPPTAIAWSIAKPDWTELPADCMSEAILAVGQIPIAKYARPGTAQMGEVLRELLPKNRVMILARHGALAWGESLDEAHNGMERLEAVADILLRAHTLGELSRLPQDEIEVLKQMRASLGPQSL